MSPPTGSARSRCHSAASLRVAPLMTKRRFRRRFKRVRGDVDKWRRRDCPRTHFAPSHLVKEGERWREALLGAIKQRKVNILNERWGLDGRLKVACAGADKKVENKAMNKATRIHNEQLSSWSLF